MLSGLEILEQIKKNNIIIEPFNPECLNPNSYNLTLNEKMLIYTTDLLDLKKDNETKEVIISDDGYLLMPGNLYIGSSNEYTETFHFAPQISGRSSIGRVGISLHTTAGLGANGYKGNWTFSIYVTRPTKVFKNMQIGQIYYFPIVGEQTFFDGKYQNLRGIKKSRIYESADLNNNSN